MPLSKKETSILIEVVFSLVFSFIFLPLFYENQNDNLSSINNLIRKITPIIIYSVLYFSIAYAVLELIFKTKLIILLFSFSINFYFGHQIWRWNMLKFYLTKEKRSHFQDHNVLQYFLYSCFSYS